MAVADIQMPDINYGAELSVLGIKFAADILIRIDRAVRMRTQGSLP